MLVKRWPVLWMVEGIWAASRAAYWVLRAIRNIWTQPLGGLYSGWQGPKFGKKCQAFGKRYKAQNGLIFKQVQRLQNLVFSALQKMPNWSPWTICRFTRPILNTKISVVMRTRTKLWMETRFVNSTLTLRAHLHMAKNLSTKSRRSINE